MLLGLRWWLRGLLEKKGLVGLRFIKYEIKRIDIKIICEVNLRVSKKGEIYKY